MSYNRRLVALANLFLEIIVNINVFIDLVSTYIFVGLYEYEILIIGINIFKR